MLPGVSSSLTCSQISDQSVSFRHFLFMRFEYADFSAYAVLLIPLSIVRVASFRDSEIESAATIFVGIWFASTGLVLVILFLLFRPDFGLAIPMLWGFWEMMDNSSPQGAAEQGIILSELSNSHI